MERDLDGSIADGSDGAEEEKENTESSSPAAADGSADGSGVQGREGSEDGADDTFIAQTRARAQARRGRTLGAGARGGR